jgi:cell pole-organizing protein PopZ
MRVADGNAEPSMEDILSSIKRIIAEDSDAALAGPRAKRSVGLTPLSRPEPAESVDDNDEILELTEAVAPEPDLVPEPVAETPKPVAAPIAKAKAKEPDPVPAEPKPTLVSSTTAEASRSSLAALSAMIVKPNIAGADTLEGLVRDMLKPLLADWLDANLPEIVERQVAQEIARISARG